MSTDTQIVDWLDKNLHRLDVIRSKRGGRRIMWADRDDKGQYHWREHDGSSIRDAVSAAIAADRKLKEAHATAVH